MAEFEYEAGQEPSSTVASQPGENPTPPAVREATPLQKILHDIVTVINGDEEWEKATREKIAALEN